MEELFLQAQNGSRKDFAEWCWKYQAKIGQFGFQNGISTKESGAYQIAVFQEIYDLLAGIKPKEAEEKLWQAAIRKLSAYQKKIELGEADVLRFEEDRETHTAILELDEQQRIAVTLVYFIKKSPGEAAWITGETEKQINEQITSAREFLSQKLELMSDVQTEKRLEFVGKSYARISLPFPEEELFFEQGLSADQIFNEDSTVKAKVNKRTAVLLTTAGLFISGVVGGSFLLNDPNPNVIASSETASAEIVTDQMVEGWREGYKAIRASSPERLGVDPKKYEQFAYVKEADAALKRVLGKENIEKQKDKPKEMEREVKKLLLKIETPKGMEVAFPDAFLTGEEVEDFLYNYELKTKELIVSNEEILNRHASEMENVRFNGEMSVEKLLANNEQFPEEIERMLSGLREQSLTIAKHPSAERFITRRNMETFYMNDILSSYLYTNSHFSLMMNAPYFDEQGLLVPIEAITQSLMMLEEALILEDPSSGTFEDYAPIFMETFWLTLKGSESQPVFDQKGVVKPEFQQIWKELAMQTRNPMIYTLLPILEEMEASGWTASKSYDQLAYQDILTALKLEKEGRLAEKLPNGKTIVEAAQIKSDNYDSAPIIQLYKEFSADHDLTLLEGVPPLDVLLLFDYANQLEDAVTMWHLMADDENKPALKDYTANWRKMSVLKEEAHYLEAGGDSVYRIGGSLVMQPFISFKEERTMAQNNPTLIMEKNNTWLVQTQLYEAYDLTDKETAFSKKVESSYAAFYGNRDAAELKQLSAGEIGGMFLLAMEKKDTETMVALSEESVQNQASEILEAAIYSRALPSFKDLSYLNFSLDYAYYGTGEERVMGTLGLESNMGNTVNGNQLTVVKTAKGWRIGDLNMY